MSFAATAAIIAGSIAVAGGTAQAIDGGIRANRAKKAAQLAKIELEKQKNAFRSLDTSNPYLNMENAYEDLTVNTQAAEFAKQQSMQQQANILQDMRTAAGGSGVAALAQALANQGSLDAQKSSALISTQERSNQLQEMRETSRIQGMERQGEIISRQAEMGKVESLMGLSADELANQRMAQAQARSQMYEGIGNVASGVMTAGGGLGKAKGFGDINLKSVNFGGKKTIPTYDKDLFNNLTPEQKLEFDRILQQQQPKWPD